jgi:hypothetical protein
MTTPKTPGRKTSTSSTRSAKGSAALESAVQDRPLISPELRHHMIRDAAYYRAERHGFHGGDPLRDWLEAEAEIDRLFDAGH